MNQLAALANAFPLIWLCALALLGLIIGSFLNVVIYRLPLMLESRWRRDALQQLALPEPMAAARFDLLLPRSACPHCRRPIAPGDNIPLLSWLLLRGRARCCGERIHWRYPLIEAATALLFVLAGWRFSADISLLGALLFLALLLTLAAIDLQTLLLPDVLTLPLLWLGLLFNLAGGLVPLEQATIGAVAGYLSLWGLFWLFKFATGKEAMGYGDFKLLAALGAWLGWQALPNLVLIAATSGLLVTVLQRWLTRQEIDRPLAFGPWLALAGGISLLLLTPSYG